MIRRAKQTKHGSAPPADLLVCFPSRAHLTFMPKKVLSPARLMDHSFHRRHQNQPKRLPSTRIGSGLGHTLSPPDSWDKDKRCGSDVSEPCSPKVTCAGQIKVRPRSAAANCKSWQSVMEEIERIHKKSKNDKKKGSWGDALGIKKEVMQFLTCLKNVKLDFRCFGNMPECDMSSDEEGKDEEEEDEEAETSHNPNVNQSDHMENIEKEKDLVFSKWFMVLQDTDTEKEDAEPEDGGPSSSPLPPPPNALLLMRCRSAPAKKWLENRAKIVVEQEERDLEAASHQEEAEVESVDHKGRKKLRDYLLVMDQYDTDFYKLSTDIAKETWVVSSINSLSRSRSWKQ